VVRRVPWLIIGIACWGFLYGQLPSRPQPVREWMGVRFQTSSAAFSNLTLKNTVVNAGYEVTYPKGYAIAFYVGTSQALIPSRDSTVTDLTGDKALYLEGRLEQSLGILLFSAGVRRYTLNGSVKESLGAISNKFTHAYTLWEFPVSVGLRETVGRTTLALGVSKTYLYGKDVVEIAMLNGGQTTSFGSLNQSFIDQQELLYSGTFMMEFSKNYTIQLTVESNGKDTSLFHFTFYTPVKSGS